MTINLRVQQLSQDDAFTDVKVVIDVADDYPNVIPDVSLISSGLKREHITNIKSEVIDSCKDLIGQPMLVSMVTFIQEYVEKKANLFKSLVTDVNEQSVDLKSSANSSAGDTWTALLHIDHMRSKTKYCKHLERWTKELNLTGRLMFCKRLILALLQGTRPDIKVSDTFMRQWRRQTAEKVTHIKGRLMNQAMVLYNYVPFQNGNLF